MRKLLFGRLLVSMVGLLLFSGGLSANLKAGSSVNKIAVKIEEGKGTLKVTKDGKEVSLDAVPSDYSEKVTLKAEPSSGYKFESGRGKKTGTFGGEKELNESEFTLSFEKVNGDDEEPEVPEEPGTVEFKKIGGEEPAGEGYKVSWNTPENGTFTVKNGEQTVTPGSTVPENTEELTLIVKPNNGYDLDKVTANGDVVSNLRKQDDGTYTGTYYIDESTTFVVSFKKAGAVSDKITIKYNKPENGTLKVMKSFQTVASGAQVENPSSLIILATPAKGYELDKLKINDKETPMELAQGASSYTATYLADTDVTIEVTFKKAGGVSNEVTVKFNNPENGTLQVRAKFKPITSGTKVAKGISLLLIAKPNSGYELDELKINGEKVEMSPAEDPQNLTYTALYTAETDVDAVVTFKKKGGTTEEVTITYNATPKNGKLEVKDGDKAVTSGSKVKKGATLTIIATADSKFALENGKVKIGSEEVTLKRKGQVYTGTYVAKSDITIVATFVADSLVEALAAASVKVYPNPASEYVVVEGVANASVVVVALDGRVITNAKTNAEGVARIDLAGVAAGTYLLQVNGQTSKFVVR